MTDEKRRAIVTAGMAGIVGAVLPWVSLAAKGTNGIPLAGGAGTDSTPTIELPGFFDLQVNGVAGVDFSDPQLTGERLVHAASAIGKTGVTRFLPTLITSSRRSRRSRPSG